MAEETSKAGTQWAILIAGCAVTFVFSIGLAHWQSSESSSTSVAVESAQIANISVSINNLHEELKTRDDTLTKRDDLERQVIEQEIKALADKMAQQEAHLDHDDQRLDQMDGHK